MKKTILLSMVMCVIISANAQLTAPGVKWDESYSFDKVNVFKVEFYAKNNELMRIMNCKTYFQSTGDNFVVKMGKDGNAMETVIDKKNEIAIQIFGSGSPTPSYNAGRYKYPTEEDLKKLEIIPTTETKQILGYTCKKYTYTYKRIFGEVWLTDQVTLSNDLGVFRAAKMAAKHNTLSVAGFVMEMTTEDSGGGKTLMTTVSLNYDEKYNLNFNGVNMSTAINKINYYTF